MNAFSDILTAIGLFVILFAAFETGFRAGRKARGEGEGSGGQIGAIQGAVLGLLGLLLAFTFAAAGTRFFERQDLITTEANAIGTATLRADLLAEPHRSSLRNTLQEYTQRRVELSSRLRTGIVPSELAEIDAQLERIWAAAIAGVNDRPNTIVGVLPPVNDVIDLHTSRLSASRKKLPLLVWGVLIGCSLLAQGVMGYGAGVGRHRRAPLTISLTLLVGASLWITYDLDNPRGGLLRLNDAPLQALKF